MKFETLVRHLSEFQFHTTIGSTSGKRLYDFILAQRPTECLELGFAHGTSSCYVAAALDELGEGHLTSVDLERAREWQTPSIEQLLARTGLERYVTVERENTSYTWFLKKKIETQTSNGACVPLYDFCFIDGAKHWGIDGFAFFLVDKLLKENGWLLFDDFNWTRTKLADRESLDYISFLEMGKDEIEEAHIEQVFRLLVLQHPSYANFRIEDNNWAWANKIKTDVAASRALVVHERKLDEKIKGALLKFKMRLKYGIDLHPGR